MDLKEFVKLAISPRKVWEMAAKGKQSRGRIFDALYRSGSPKGKAMAENLAKRTGNQWEHVEYLVDKKLGGRERIKSFDAQARHPASGKFNSSIIRHLTARG